MAQDTVDKAIETAKLEPHACVTQTLAIHGSEKIIDRADHLYVYGSDREALLELVKENPEWAEKLHPRLEYAAAEVIWAVRHELGRTVEDVLARRVRALFLDARAAMEMAPAVAGLMAKQLNKDKTWENDQVAEFELLAQGYF